MFAEGGPKASFLAEMLPDRGAVQSELTPSRPLEQQGSPSAPSFDAKARVDAEDAPIPKEIGQKAKVLLVIQVGATIRSFKELPVTVGKDPNCDFHLPHPSIFDRHAVFFFARDQYWIKDLTGQGLISINGEAIHFEAPLRPECTLKLSPKGPAFRFLGGGRLAEIDEPSPQEPIAPKAEKDEPLSREKERENGSGPGSMLKKFLRRKT
jgi:hypothetical protein